MSEHYPNAVPPDNVSVNIDAGEVVGIIGPSGTGRSTFLRCIDRLETPTSGEIWIDGVNVCDPNTDLPAIRKKMGWCSSPSTCFRTRWEAKARAYPDELSGGQKQRVAIARALARGVFSRIFFMDQGGIHEDGHWLLRGM